MHITASPPGFENPAASLYRLVFEKKMRLQIDFGPNVYNASQSHEVSKKTYQLMTSVNRLIY